jgi:threonine synthase
MDILVSSNLERLLFSLCDEKVEKVSELMEQLSAKGVYQISSSDKEHLRGFYGYYASEPETAEAIRDMYKAAGYIMDTHTAVAYTAYKKYLEQNPKDNSKTVIVSTASPYKFTADVMKSIDAKYSGLNDFTLMGEIHKLIGTEPPKGIRDLDKIPILHKTVCEKHEMKRQVEKILDLQ